MSRFSHEHPEDAEERLEQLREEYDYYKKLKKQLGDAVEEVDHHHDTT
jgi:hypothetical protein